MDGCCWLIFYINRALLEFVNGINFIFFRTMLKLVEANRNNDDSSNSINY